MKKLLLILLLAGCSQNIADYSLKSPVLVAEAVATNTALLKKNLELVDAYQEAIQRNVCGFDKEFLAYLQKHFKDKYDITYGENYCVIK